MPDGAPAEKPYTFDDLQRAMDERAHFKAELDGVTREIGVEDSKLRSLRDREAAAATRLAAEEQKVLRIAASLVRGAAK